MISQAGIRDGASARIVGVSSWLCADKRAKRKPLSSEQLRDEDVLARQPPLREALLKMVSQEGVTAFRLASTPYGHQSSGNWRQFSSNSPLKGGGATMAGDAHG